MDLVKLQAERRWRDVFRPSRFGGVYCLLQAGVVKYSREIWFFCFHRSLANGTNGCFSGLCLVQFVLLW